MNRADKTISSLALLVLTAGAGAQEPAPRLPETVIQKVLAKARQSALPHDDPDKAAIYYFDQRRMPGTDVDPMALYAEALDHMERLPRHSARLGAYLPAPHDAGPPHSADA